MEKLTKIFREHGGYARMIEMKNQGIHTRTIARALTEGIIDKIKPGLYKLVNYSWDEHESFATVCNANSKAIICLLSAAAHWKLTTFNPNQIDVAVPHSTDKFKLNYPPIKVYYFINKYYDLGMDELKTKSGNVRIYNREKTICDLFRYQKKIGEDIVLESLKSYLSERKDKNIPKLMQYAEYNNVAKKVEIFLKGMLS